MRLDPTATVELQSLLTLLGYDTDGADGDPESPALWDAARQFAAERGLDHQSQALSDGWFPADLVTEIQAAAAQLHEPEPKRTGITRVGAWAWAGDLLDDPGRDDDRADRALERAERLGLTDIDLMVTPERPARAGRFEPRIDAAAFRGLARRYADSGMDVHLTVWCYPGERYVTALRRYLTETADRLRSIVLDTEHILRLGSGARGAVKLLSTWLPGLGLPVYVTSYASMTGRDRVLVDGLRDAGLECYGLAQAYSVHSTRRTGRTDSSSVYWPGRTQRYAAKVWNSRDGNVIGLAGYNQSDFPGLSVEDAMTAAWDAAEALGYTELRYWSLVQLGEEVGHVLRELIAERARR